MKKIFLITGIAALLVSCNLDTEFYSEAKKNDYITGEAAVNNLVMGCYNGMQAAKNAEWAVTELRANNTRMYNNGSASAATVALRDLDQSTINASSTYVEEYWNSTYAAIYRSNEVLANLNKVDNVEKRVQFEGEVKFLRAMHYFNLVRLWGGVFKVTTPLSAAEARNMQRSPRAEIYELIISDLTDIIDNHLLPAVYPTAETGRATLTATKALLAKVYVTIAAPGEEKYAEAGVLLDEVLTATGNPTVPYDRIFAIDNEMNAEIIFTVRYKSGNLGLGSPFGNYFAPTNNGGAVIIGTASAFNYPSDNIIAAYAPADRRKDVSLKEGYYNDKGVWISAAPCRYINKFMSPITTNYDGESDFPVIRVADVALLAAEVENELNGPTTKAFSLLNAVRSRAGLTALTATEAPAKYDLREAIRRERRLELAFENQWFFDLLRWGIAMQTINNFFITEALYSGYTFTVMPIAEWQLMLPIPQSVMNINPDIAQNIGY